MTYSHAEATLIALVKFDIHFLTRDLTNAGVDATLAKTIATDLVENKGWTRKRESDS